LTLLNAVLIKEAREILEHEVSVPLISTRIDHSCKNPYILIVAGREFSYPIQREMENDRRIVEDMRTEVIEKGA